MTKAVRIENADNSDHVVVVQTWQKGIDSEPDAMIKEEELTHPTQMCEGMIWQEQYLVVKEKDAG